MSERDESVEERLQRLADATRALHGSPGLQARVLQAIAAEAAPSWLAATTRASRKAIVAAALVATACAVFAVRDESVSDEASAVAYTALEIEW
jgi:hypothetical protein